MSSLFISFEGLEGSGKSTQASLLASRLKEEGYNVIVTREPGGSRIGEQIRAITHARENVDLKGTAEAYLMAASRAQHVREIIRPSLELGKIVVCDRYIDSSLAYQGYGRGLGEETIETLNNLALDGIYPDITVLLDVSPDFGHERRSRNTQEKIDRLDLQQRDFYVRVYEGYKKLAEKYRQRYIVIDSSRDIDIVAAEVWNKVSPRIRSSAETV